MAPLFSKADLNKLWHDFQNEATLICAKFDNDLFSISKVIGHKTKWPRFFGLPCMSVCVRTRARVLGPNISIGQGRDPNMFGAHYLKNGWR